MNCPTCNKPAKCHDSRPAADNTRRRRWRCKCGISFTTLEQIVAVGDYYQKGGIHALAKEKATAEAKDQLLRQLNALLTS